MKFIGVTLIGRKDAIENVRSDLVAMEAVRAVEGTPKPAIGFILSPGSQQPSELFECIVSISVLAASLAIYDDAKAEIVAVLANRDVAVSPLRGEMGVRK